MLGIGTQELLIILLILLLLFGGKKLPELSRSIGQAIKEMRKAMTGTDDEEKSKKDSTVKKPSSKN
jgi:TatA/E family protein of Tat protein translocase